MRIAAISRRRLLAGAAAIAAAAPLGGCESLADDEQLGNIVQRIEQTLTMRMQRLLIGRGALAREFEVEDLSPQFKVNGTDKPDGDAYQRLLDGGFADWTLVVDGKVRTPLKLSLADLKNLPARTQITRHDCVEGWSAIGQWTGVPLSHVLDLATPTADARYVVFHCADQYEQASDGNGQYYESIDLVDARHPQTILAYGMNGKDLTVGHGAPLRLRVERQLGYKQAKYLMRIQVVDSFARIGRGHGGFWPDRGYEWYAGV
jgi:DMSO/TMAO reductase YedYZ molybdopterin-dependent catalytic subunit